MPDATHGSAAGGSIARHLARGAVGFGLIGAAIALTPSVGPAALLLTLPGAVALGGCPTCWITGLIQTVSDGKVQRDCTDTNCTLRPAQTSVTKKAPSYAGD